MTRNDESIIEETTDFWSSQTGEEISPEAAREAERQGAHVWTYDYNFGRTNAEANRFFAGLYTWAWGLEGNMPYAYMDCGKQDPYFDANWTLSTPGGVCGFTIPSPAGPVPGVSFEGWREGVDDVRYLQLLETRAAAAPEENPVAQRAKDWLTRLRVKCQTNRLQTYRYDPAWIVYLDPHEGLGPDDYDAVRARAARYIVKLPPVADEHNPEPAKWTPPVVPPLESDAYAEASPAECLAALRSGTIAQKRQAASALALREPEEALPALEDLIALLDEPDVRIVALRALANIGPYAAPAIPGLREQIESEDAFIRLGATYVLAMIGQEAATVLEQCTRDPDHVVAEHALVALAKLEEQ